MRVQGTAPTSLRVLFFGAGSSAVGVADAVAAFLQHEAGLSEDRAKAAIYFVDSKGLVAHGRGDAPLPEHKLRYARQESEVQGMQGCSGTLRQFIYFIILINTKICYLIRNEMTKTEYKGRY